MPKPGYIATQEPPTKSTTNLASLLRDRIAARTYVPIPPAILILLNLRNAASLDLRVVHLPLQTVLIRGTQHRNCSF
jgi:hypothetical protein